MRCLECSHTITLPGMVLAMEQREHFAMVRHAEICPTCAERMLPIFREPGCNSRFWHQSTNCCYCGDNMPIARLRFDIKDRAHDHIAICEGCYNKLRDHLVRHFCNLVAFVEKEWHARNMAGKARMPLANGTTVIVKPHVPRYGSQYGFVTAFRGLVQPWFGYNVKLQDGRIHFFHERDLDPVNVAQRTEAVG